MNKILDFIKKYKLIFAIGVVLIIITIILIMISGKKEDVGFQFNDDSTPGNSAGNLYNTGLFCEDDNLIYFSNINDSGALYSMKKDLSDFKKISSDNVRYINVDENHLYYSRLNVGEKTNASSLLASFNSIGLYRCSKKGTNTITLYDDFTGLLSQYGNYVFYQHYESSTGTSLYKVRIDGDGEMKISDNSISPGTYKNNFMYFSEMDNEHYIYMYNVITSTSELFLAKRSMYPIICGDYIYFMSIDDNYSLFRYPLDGGECQQVVSERCSTYNITPGGKYLYYQVDGSDTNKLCKMDLETKEVTVLKEGNFSNINITSDYVFFYDSLGSTVYYIEHDANIAKKFNPEID